MISIENSSCLLTPYYSFMEVVTRAQPSLNIYGKVVFVSMMKEIMCDKKKKKLKTSKCCWIC